MSAAIFLDSFAALTDRGMLSTAGFTPWEPDQRGAADVRRSQVLTVPYPTFGKLTPADRLAFGAAGLLFSHYPISSGKRCAICAGVPFGSLSTDRAYVESVKGQFPSPALFSATLPSSPVSEIAIHYKIKGPNRVFCQSAGSGLWALAYGIQLLTIGKAESAVVLFVKSVESAPGTGEGAVVNQHRCYAVFLTTAPRIQGCRWRVDFDWRPSAASTQKTDDEPFFAGLTESLSADAASTSSLDRFGIHGHFSIEKRT